MTEKHNAPTVACAASASLDALILASDALRGIDCTGNPFMELAVRRSVTEIMSAHDGVCALLHAANKVGGGA